jgi:hypothetical protein
VADKLLQMQWGGCVMSDGPSGPSSKAERKGLDLCDLNQGDLDSIGSPVHEVIFRGQNYAIYRSDRGIYVHFADDSNVDVRCKQRNAYVKLSSELCELRYLTSQMRSNGLLRRLGRLLHHSWPLRSALLYDHNMAQALMLLMESAEQRVGRENDKADTTEKEAEEIAKRALDMAIQRNTSDNTIRYVRNCVVFAMAWAAVALIGHHWLYGGPLPLATDTGSCYLLASVAGILGATFSVIVRAQSFELKPCDDSRMNSLMSLIRVGMGGIAGPVLVLLLTTLIPHAMAGTEVSGATSGINMVAILGLVGGFAERLVPNLVRGAAEKLEAGAGTPVQATGKTKDQSRSSGGQASGKDQLQTGGDDQRDKPGQ